MFCTTEGQEGHHDVACPKRQGYAEPVCLCVCFPQILLLLQPRRGMDRDGGSRSCSNRTEKVSWHFYPQWLVLLIPLSPFSFSLYPHSFHFSSIQRMFTYQDAITSFLLCPVGWIAAQAEGNTGRDSMAGMVVGHKIRKGTYRAEG